MYISRTNVRLRTLRPEDFVLVAQGSPLPGVFPSKELPMHRAAYQSRPDFRVLLHFHCLECVVASLLLGPHCRLPFFTRTHRNKLGPIPVLEDYPAGSQQLARAVGEEIREADGVLLYRHGILVGGDQVETAFDRVEYLVEACRLFLTLRHADPELVRQLLLPFAENSM